MYDGVKNNSIENKIKLFLFVLDLSYFHYIKRFEDAPFVSDKSRAVNNARLVRDIVEAAPKYDRTVVAPDHAREIIGLKLGGFYG